MVRINFQMIGKLIDNMAIVAARIKQVEMVVEAKIGGEIQLSDTGVIVRTDLRIAHKDWNALVEIPF